MVKTHLPSHMDSVREKWRPKHQLLILKCYPRLPKNSTADASPNSSELSYLLYYASTRKSKLQKVGAFLERKTSADVTKAQSAKVSVTLQILSALIEKKVAGGASSFALIAPYVLRILTDVMSETNDVSLVEACLSTWEVFCKHQDQATLAADQQYRTQYEQIVRQWAMFAKKETSKRLGKGAGYVSIPVAIRLRRAGLSAIKAIFINENLNSETGRQLGQCIPAILTNLRGNDTFSLSHLLALSKRNEEEEKEHKGRRHSIGTVHTFTGNESALSDPRAAEGTIQDSDAYAEEETAASAIDCLRKAFESDNRPQIRVATSQVLFFLAYEQIMALRNPTVETTSTAVDWTSWSAKLFEMIVTWTPVQDRFIVLVTTTETLSRLPLTEESVNQHLLLTQLIDDILRSDLNLIGLSIMDVLLGFIQQILRILQLGNNANGSSNDMARTQTNNTAGSTRKPLGIATSMQLVLLNRLKSCISDLATHVYYTDQIPDMVAAILLRLKPSATPTNPPSAATIAAAIQEPNTTVNDTGSQVSLSRERTQSTSLPGGFFSFDAARQIALESVKEIIIVANSSKRQSSIGMAQSRNLVSLTVWEGTQWLLRDPAPNVRRAYVDALCTWLMLETRNTDSRVQETQLPTKLSANGSTARRALSNASRKGKSGKKARHTFLQLLHLAVYENALQHAGSSESDILLLHLLLVSMSPRLGVNAVQSALPMILALQEEIPRAPTPIAKIRIGSLVHGYFWQLTEQFDFANDSVGREIFNEINRRKKYNLWMLPLSVPATPLDRIPPFGVTISNVDEGSFSSESLRPYDRRQQLVEKIAEGYAYAAASAAPVSPGSPNRQHTGPILDRHASSYMNAKQIMSLRLSDTIIDGMMAVWNKEEVLASITAAGPRTPSFTGSQSGQTQGQSLPNNHRQMLGATGNGPSGRNDGFGISTGSSSSLRQAMNAQFPSDSPDRRPSASTFATSADETGERRALKIEELRRVLNGGAAPENGAVSGRYGQEDSTSDSLVEVGDDVSDFDSQSQREAAGLSHLIATGGNPKGKEPAHNDHDVTNGSIRSARLSVRSSVYSKAYGSKKDLAALLDGLDIGDTSSRRYGSGRPPY